MTLLELRDLYHVSGNPTEMILEDADFDSVREQMQCRPTTGRNSLMFQDCLIWRKTWHDG